MIARRWAPLVLVLLAAVACRKARGAPPQPIAFNHAIHVQVRLVDRALTCTDCHPGAERGIHAGLPSLQVCLRCHMRPQGDPPTAREQQVRELAAAGGPFRWIQVTRNPGHVFFAHGPHVTVAKFSCQTCHGDVAAWTEPPRVPVARLTHMASCMSCHRTHGAPNSCETCHQ